MFDTMVITKAVAGFCSALLVFLLGGWIADLVYKPHGPAPVAAFIDLGDDAAMDAAPVEEEEVDYQELYLLADAEAGAGLWRNCRACHALEAGRNGTGPYLHGVVGRPINAADGFSYSGALSALGEVWTVEALSVFIESPRTTAPGTTMNYAGMRSRSDRLNLIAYLERESN